VRMQNIYIRKENDSYGSLVVFHDLTTERQIDQMKTEMINVIVHELRNPLNSIMGFTSLMIDDPGLGEEERLHFLQIVHESSHNLNQLINRFLEIQRLELGKVNYPKQMTDLKLMLEFLVESQQPVAMKKAITFNVSIAPSLPEIYVSATLMREAYLNLISNAIKYGDENRSIDIELFLRDSSMIFMITDHGYGISAEDQKKLFTKFFRVMSNAKAAEQVGTGLGLAHVKSIVAFHQGTIQLESNPDIGCKFTLIIPIQNQA
jgi:signal transduction histidine kinase